MTQSTDRIDKEILLRAPRSRVWRALTDAEEFGTWFRVRLDGSFRPGACVKGRITYPGYEHLTMELTVEQMQPERLFSYRWHPYAVDPGVDYSSEPSTLVEFYLDPAPEGTLLRVSESGFDKLPPARRAEAYRMNEPGWTEQLHNIERHVTAAAA
ncbi:MAG: SRPBCC family protein [Polyangia bacterium]